MHLHVVFGWRVVCTILPGPFALALGQVSLIPDADLFRPWILNSKSSVKRGGTLSLKGGHVWFNNSLWPAAILERQVCPIHPTERISIQLDTRAVVLISPPPSPPPSIASSSTTHSFFLFDNEPNFILKI